MKTSYNENWMPKKRKTLFDGEIRMNPIEGKFDKQLEDLKRMNQEIN